MHGVMAELQQSPAVTFELAAAAKTHRVTITRDLFVKKSERFSSELRRLIVDMRERHGNPESSLALLLTHRITRLPGWKEMLAEIPAANFIELQPGSAASGALRLWDQLSKQAPGSGVALFTSRPWPAVSKPSAVADQSVSPETTLATRPTHVLYRNLAYPISDRPLTIGTGSTTDGVRLKIQGEAATVSRKHCTIQLRGDCAVLIDHSTSGTLVDETPVSGPTILSVGQTIRLGTSGEELLLIASLETDAT
jgi:pSer/pThr/pTyr-binding forkhead associated (FHA) protein